VQTINNIQFLVIKSYISHFLTITAFGCKNNLNILLLEVFGHFFDVSFENN